MVPPERDTADLPQDAKLQAALALEQFHAEKDIEQRWRLMAALLLIAGVPLGVYLLSTRAPEVSQNRFESRLLAALFVLPAVAAWHWFMRRQGQRNFDTQAVTKTAQARTTIPGSGVWLRADEKGVRREVQRDTQHYVQSAKRWQVVLISLPVIAIFVGMAIVAATGRIIMPVLEIIMGLGVPEGIARPYLGMSAVALYVATFVLGTGSTIQFALAALALALCLVGELIERHLFFVAEVAPKMPGGGTV